MDFLRVKTHLASLKAFAVISYQLWPIHEELVVCVPVLQQDITIIFCCNFGFQLLENITAGTKRSLIHWSFSIGLFVPVLFQF